MREMKQTATFAVSLPIIALTGACWGMVFGPAAHVNLRFARGALRDAFHPGL
jgi:hypothetical protein